MHCPPCNHPSQPGRRPGLFGRCGQLRLFLRFGRFGHAGGLGCFGILATVCLLCLSGAATAQGSLPDPTRPPSAVLAATAAAAQPGGRALAEPAAPPPPPPLPVLQAVQLPARGAASALIDGRLVRVGDTVGERQTVSAIDAQGVSLRGAGGPQRLSLLSADGKQPPGSIVITRSTHFAPEPGARPAEAASPSAPGAALPRANPLPATAPENDTAASSTPPVAVAGRNRP